MSSPPLTKKNNSLLYFTIVYYTSKLWYYETLCTMENNGTMEEIKVLWTKLHVWYYDQNFGIIPKTTELRFMKKKMVDYHNKKNCDL